MNSLRYFDLLCAMAAAILSLSNFAVRRNESGAISGCKWLFAALAAVFGYHAAVIYLNKQGVDYLTLTEAARPLLLIWLFIEVLFLINGKHKSQRVAAGQAHDRGRWNRQSLVSNRRPHS
ncbi:MAG: hypothetical protein AB7U82_27815 [Blastocatellales bacterium]